MSFFFVVIVVVVDIFFFLLFFFCFATLLWCEVTEATSRTWFQESTMRLPCVFCHWNAQILIIISKPTLMNHVRQSGMLTCAVMGNMWKKKNGTVSGKHLPLSVWEKRERERHEQLDRPCLVYRCSHTHALHCLFVILTVKWIPLPFFFFDLFIPASHCEGGATIFFFLAPPSSHLFTRLLLSSMRAAPRIFFFSD